MTETTSNKASVRAGLYLLVYLAWAVGVELILLRAPPFDELPVVRALQLAVALDGVLLGALLVHGAIELARARPAFGALLMGLSIVPLARVVAQTLSLDVTVPDMGVYLRFYGRLFVIALVLLVALYFLARADRFGFRDLGRPADGRSGVMGFLLAALVLVLSPAFGLLAFLLLEPRLPTVAFDDPQLAVALGAIAVAALWQEMTFRGLVLHDANRVFGWAGAATVSALAGGVLLLGTVPVLEARMWPVVAVGVGLGFLYAAQVQNSRSLVIVVLGQFLLQAAFFVAGPHYA